jgi:hypothetical protein
MTDAAYAISGERLSTSGYIPPEMPTGHKINHWILNTPGGSDTSFTLVDYLSLGTDAWLSRNVALNAELKYQSTNSGLTNSNVDTSGVIFTLGVRMTF